MKNDENVDLDGLALLCDQKGKIIDILFDGSNFTDESKPVSSFMQLVDGDSFHKAENFFDELINQKIAYNWEINTQTVHGISIMKYSGVAFDHQYLIVIANSNYCMSKLLEKFIQTLSHDEKKEEVLQNVLELSCQKDKRDQGIFDEITHLNNELVTVQRELAKKNAELLSLNQTLEQRVDERTKEITQLLQQKDDFIVHLGHDLKNPLGPIINLVPIIKKKEEDEQLREMLTIVENNSVKLHNLMKKTMRYAHVNSSEFNPKFEEVNIQDIVQQIIESKLDECTSLGIRIENNLNPDLTMITDKKLLFEIFDELLSNAMKFSFQGGTILIDDMKNDESIQFNIKDEGIGLTNSQIENIFYEFYKTDESRHDLYSHGLGLSIIKIIVEKLKGTIWVESEGLEKGSIFHFQLPLCQEK